MATNRDVFEGEVILAVAVPAEARAVLGAFGADRSLADRAWRRHRVADGVEVLVTGVGKANAAGALAHVVPNGWHGAVVSLGVAGALPGGGDGGDGGNGGDGEGDGGVAIGDVVVARRSVYADEGLLSPDGFSDCEAMGFSLGPAMDGGAIEHDAALVETLAAHADHVGVIATVSTCSGTDAGAMAVVERTGAIAEAMEGAALAQVAAHLGLSSAEVRAISNTTGDRAQQVWDLQAGLASIGRYIAATFVR